jgi:hypothetical protein
VKVGDLVKHKGGSGWHDMEGKIGVLLKRCSPPFHERWLVSWCSVRITPFQRDFRHWQEHLEVVIKKNKKNT